MSAGIPLQNFASGAVEVASKVGSNIVNEPHHVEGGLFSVILGLDTKPAWFNYILEHAGEYIFSFALVLSLLKLRAAYKRFFKEIKNRNFQEGETFAWKVVNTGMIVVALAGSLAAAATFVVATPILFVVAMTTDAIRAAGLFALNVWNWFALEREYQQKKADLIENEEATQLDHEMLDYEYNKLEETYYNNIINYAQHAVIGIIVAASVAVTFLFPVVGLSGASGAILFTLANPVTLKGLLGGIAGAVLAIKLAYDLGAFGWAWEKTKKAGSWLKSTFISSDASEKRARLLDREEPTQRQLDDNRNTVDPISPGQKSEGIEVVLPTSDEIIKKINSPFFKGGLNQPANKKAAISFFMDGKEKSKEIETIARDTLEKLVDNKIQSLQADLDRGEKSHFRLLPVLAARERNIQRQKLLAVVMIKRVLALTKIGSTESKFDDNWLEPYRRHFDNHIIPIEENMKSMIRGSNPNLTSALDYIEKYLNTKHEIDQSLFRSESDTRDLINAVTHYNDATRVKPAEKVLTIEVPQEGRGCFSRLCC